jgi:hypothetical protein
MQRDDVGGEVDPGMPHVPVKETICRPKLTIGFDPALKRNLSFRVELPSKCVKKIQKSMAGEARQVFGLAPPISP